jgi:hypothetical protein
MGDVIEESERGRFFGRRNMFTGMTAFVGTLFAGWLLFVLKPTHPLLGFLILFGLAFLFRAASAFYLSRMDDPPERGLGNESPDVIEFLRNADKNPFGRFTLFVCLFYIAVYLSAPFFAVYQLTILKLDYMTFTFLACASAIASFLSMILWGKYVDRIGSKNVLVTTGFLIPLVPLIYALTTSLPLLIMTELMSGLLWAGFNLSMSTYIFDATDRKNRTREVAEYTLLLQVATFFGAMAGSGILGLFDRTQPDGYVALFLASAMLRLAVVILFYKALQELRIVEIPVKDRLYKKFVSVRPQMGIQYEVAGENLRAAGKIATETPRQVRDEVVAFARKAREKHPVSKMKQMESQEDAQDMDAYQRRMQKKG